jgi:hypothetical protein
MTKAVWVFIAILASFGEASTENQSLLSKIERLEAENAQLKTENARLMQLEAENVWLKAEITRLQRKETVVKDALSEIQTANASTKSKMCPGRRKGQISSRRSRWAHEHCQNRCDLDLDLIDKSCLVTDRLWTWTHERLKMVKDHPHPKWTLTKNNILGGDGGTIECPCSENGKLLTKETARRRILSQVAILNVHKLADRVRSARLHTAERTLLRSNVVIAYAAATMVTCWIRQCIRDEQTTSDEVLGLLELEESNELTASWNTC